MRIAIITQPLRTNYGGILQNYALQIILKRMGHAVQTLQRDDLQLPQYPRFLLTLGKRIIKKTLGKYNRPLFYEQRYIQDYPKFTKYTLGFVNRYMETRVVDHNHPQISEHDYDAYIVGSDQVWRPSYNNIRFTFLTFAKDWNVKRIAYAASFGTNDWEFTPQETVLCKYLAKKFDAISVREYSGIHLCEEYLGVKAQQILDPTLLLQKSDYEQLIENANTLPSKGELFVHILDKSEEKYQLVRTIAQKNKWMPFEVNCAVDEHELYVPIKKRIQPPVEQWLRAFKEAKFVVTDSFHAMVFSILFNKQFVVYVNNVRGAARFQSLLKLLGYEDHLIQHSEDLERLSVSPIDYEQVNAKIATLRKTSLAFLTNALEK